MSDAVVGVLFILAGVFTLLGGAMNWDWFMNNRRARLFVALFGRQGARVFYIGLGIFIIILGFVAMIGGA